MGGASGTAREDNRSIMAEEKKQGGCPSGKSCSECGGACAQDEQRLHENLSPTTLKRLWGYIDGADTTRRTTLCLLAQFLGFADWEAYLASLATRTDIESAAFEGEGIHIDDLQQGDRVEVTWLPNRRCVFRYEGEAHFLVLESENAKLHVGDSFDAACFIIGKPMYLDNLKSQMSNDKLQMTNVSYVAGSKNGLNSVRKLP